MIVWRLIAGVAAIGMRSAWRLAAAAERIERAAIDLDRRADRHVNRLPDDIPF